MEQDFGFLFRIGDRLVHKGLAGCREAVAGVLRSPQCVLHVVARELIQTADGVARRYLCRELLKTYSREEVRDGLITLSESELEEDGPHEAAAPVLRMPAAPQAPVASAANWERGG